MPLTNAKWDFNFHFLAKMDPFAGQNGSIFKPQMDPFRDQKLIHFRAEMNQISGRKWIHFQTDNESISGPKWNPLSGQDGMGGEAFHFRSGNQIKWN